MLDEHGQEAVCRFLLGDPFLDVSRKRIQPLAPCPNSNGCMRNHIILDAITPRTSVPFHADQGQTSSPRLYRSLYNPVALRPMKLPAH